MTLTTPKLSSDLYSALVSNPAIPRTTQLFEALPAVEEEYKDELEGMLVAYGPDTTVGELLSMAKKEEPKPYTLKDFMAWFKFWA